MTLFRYISSEYTRIVLLCIGGFASLALIVDLFEKAGDFIRFDATAGQTLRYAMFRAPEFISWMIPASAMMGALLVLVAMSRRNEVVAMLAGGIARRTIVLPILTVAVLLSAFHFLIAEYVVPTSNQAARDVMNIEVKKRNMARLRRQSGGRWFHSADSFLRVGGTDGKNLLDVLVLRPGATGVAAERIEAPIATWSGTQWLLGEGTRIRTTDEGLVLEQAPAGTVLDIPIEPKDLRTDVRHTDEWSFNELRRVIRDRRRLGQDVRTLIVDLYGKMAFPFAALVMCLVALPFGFRSARSGGATTGIVIGLVLGFGYFVVMTFGLSIGRGGALHPLLAAWLPNLLFGGVGVYLAATLDRL